MQRLKTKLSSSEDGNWLVNIKPQTGLLIYVSQAVLPRTIYNVLLCSTQVAQSNELNVLGGIRRDASGCHK